MPTPFKFIPCFLLLCAFAGARASTHIDTTLKRPMFPSKTMSYQVSDFSGYFKEGIASIRKDSMDKGIKLLSTGFNSAVSKNNVNRVLNYQVLELIDLITITASGKLTEAEMKPARVFLKAILAERPNAIESTVLPYIDAAPVTLFTRRLKILLLSEKRGRVIADLNKLLATQSNLLNANILKAEILFGQNEYAECVAYCTKIIALSPLYAHARHLRAKCYVMMRQYNKALADYDETLKLFPMHYEALYERADIYMDENEYRKAINGYQAAQLMVNEYKWSDYNIARAYNRLRMPDSAMFYINNHLNRYKEDPEGIEMKGEIYYAKQDYPDAITQFNLAIAYRPDKIYFYIGRANSYFYNNEISNALADFKKALSMSKNDYYLLSRIGNCYHAMAQDDKALPWYQMALNVKPDYKDTYVDMDLSLGVLGKYKEGIEMLKKALAIDSTYAIANGNMGWDYYCIGEFDASIKYSYKALSYEEDATYAMFNIALATLCKGDFEKAKELYTQFTKTCKEKNYPINDGGITDLQDLIKKNVLVKEATYIIEHIIKKAD